MKKLRAAVVGVGYLGRFHAQKYAALSDQVELVGVCDTQIESAKKVAEELKTKAFGSIDELIGKIDLATVATTTTMHYPTAKKLLEAGIHLLVEKPLTETLSQAQELEQIAINKKLILQVGHIERFNPSFVALIKKNLKPIAFEAFRLAPFKPRALDVDVVTDLMIHDIDLMMTVMQEEVVNVRAVGAKIMTHTFDMAHATFTFKSGRRGIISANRVYPHAVRTVSVYQDRIHYFADLGNATLTKIERQIENIYETTPPNQTTESVEKKDAMLEETKAFLAAVRGERPCAVPSTNGIQAIALMETVLDSIRNS